MPPTPRRLGAGSCTGALTPSGRVRTGEDDDAVFVLLAGAQLDVTGELACDRRDGDLW
jgi:aminoglycoside 2'-N-acetyltransferase I